MDDSTLPGMPPQVSSDPITHDPFVNVPEARQTAAMASQSTMSGLPPQQVSSNVDYDPFAGLDGSSSAQKSPNAQAWAKTLGNAVKATANPGYLKTLGAGLGKGFGDIMLEDNNSLAKV